MRATAKLEVDFIIVHGACSAKIHGAGYAAPQAINTPIDPTFLALTPGIRPSWSLKTKMTRNASPLLVIGRPIQDAADPERVAQMVVKGIQEVMPIP